MESSAIVLCDNCGTPGRVVFDDDGKLKAAYFVCKCPRPTVHEVNEKVDRGT